jgi:alkanesulfonate monooxygenase SsuD/methylene tetrahydromethanopterin reductase-like flavin-dependent oxidoreductase (luciferase family)
LWYPTANINSIPWAAESGLNVCGIIETAEEYRELFDLYKKIWSDNRGQPGRLNGHVENPKIGLARNVYVAQTDREAINDARSAHEVWRKHIGFLFDEAGITIPPLERLSKFDELMDEDVFLVGSPTTVTEQIERTAEQSGINYLNCLFAFGNLNHERVMRSMRLFTQEVIPAFKGGGDGPSQIL